jgi:hypothetical protein
VKLALCRECHTIVPADKPPMEFHVCPCTKTSIAYTGDGNEVAVSGPCTILGLDDDSWQAMLTESYTRILPTLTTILHSASTVIDLDSEDIGPPDGVTHKRRADGAYATLISELPAVGSGDDTVRINVDGREITITAELFGLSYDEL